jgi:hypothetical protein
MSAAPGAAAIATIGGHAEAERRMLGDALGDGEVDGILRHVLFEGNVRLSASKQRLHQHLRLRRQLAERLACILQMSDDTWGQLIHIRCIVYTLVARLPDDLYGVFFLLHLFCQPVLDAALLLVFRPSQCFKQR